MPRKPAFEVMTRQTVPASMVVPGLAMFAQGDGVAGAVEAGGHDAAEDLAADLVAAGLLGLVVDGGLCVLHDYYNAHGHNYYPL